MQGWRLDLWLCKCDCEAGVASLGESDLDPVMTMLEEWG